MDGFVTWPRDMESAFPWYTTPNTLALFLHLVTKANIRDSFFAGKRIERGCVVTSIGRLSEETGLTDKQVRIALDHLAETGDVIREASNRFTLLRIQKFDRFCGANEGQAEGELTANEGRTEGEQVANKGQHQKKEEKGDKEEKKEKGNTSLSGTVKTVVDAWNSQCSSALKISRISPQSTRYKSLAARIDEYGVEDVLTAIGNVAQSAFLREATWFSFDWFVKPNNFPKVLDGNYNDRHHAEKREAPVAKADDAGLTDAEKQKVRDDYTARMMRGDY